jgi:hypothetical protein
MPTNRETILQTFRTAFKTALAPTLTDDNCIPADGVAFSDDNPRPALPYITIKVTVADIPVGEDEDLFGIGGLPDENPTMKTRGHRSGTVSVNGYGTDTSGWFEVFALRLRNESIRRLFDDAGIAVINRGGGVTDLSPFVDTSIEPRFLREFEISYSVVDAVAEELVAAEVIEVDLTLEDQLEDPDPLTVTVVVNI